MITIKDLYVQLPDFSLEGITLSLNKGDFFALIGPTGAGKTILLETIAGLLPAGKGQIWINRNEITCLPPEKREIGIVYQDYALFPHLTVKRNIEYGLHFHKKRRKDVEKYFNWLIERLNLVHLLNRYPDTLSGGEKQRVALARAMIIEPSLLLLDEPLSALDQNFREEIQEMLKSINKETKIPFLMVTHNMAEVLSLAKRVGVINKGRLEQIGEIKEIFHTPKTPFVAKFIGMKNIFFVSFKKNKALINGLSIQLPREVQELEGFLAIRPEDIIISRRMIKSSARNNFQGFVKEIINQGFLFEINIKVGKTEFKALITPTSLVELELKRGTSVFIAFKSTAIHIF
ncbi:ABC transporter ATP-binding protein [Candidatus Aerophobetes bacterium]|nr:ABC transporter ATP-binding protein [Candidatus Aerophobetes bacterium]